MNCARVKDNLDLYVFGELEFSEEEFVEEHLGVCLECTRLVAERRSLLELMDVARQEAPPELLANCRAGLRSRLGAQTAVRRSAIGRLREWLPEWPRLIKPAAAFAMLVLSFYAGKQFEERKAMAAAGDETSRVTTVHGMGNGMVEIVLEEPRRRMIQGGLHEDGIEQALMAATRQAPDAGMRVTSVELLRNRCNNDDVRRAMLATLETDVSPVVRLRALEALRPYAGEVEVRQSLSRVLLNDLSPNVRVQAIDLLVDRSGGDFVGTLQEVIRTDENDYIRSRCLRALSQLRASPGVF